MSDLLEKMGQAAKTLKKSQTKAKERLIKKAARLSPQDLERIAVLKRVFVASEEEAHDDAASSSSKLSAAAPPPGKGVADLHQTLQDMMKGVAGTSDVVAGLGAAYTKQEERSLALSSAQGPMGLPAGDEGARSARVMKRLPSLRRLPSASHANMLTDGTISEESRSVQE